MANLFIGKNKGQTQKDIVKGSSTNATNIEVRIDDTTGMTRDEIKRALVEIGNALLVDTTINFK